MPVANRTSLAQLIILTLIFIYFALLRQRFISDSEINGKESRSGIEVFGADERQINLAVNYLNRWKHYNNSRSQWLSSDLVVCETIIESIDRMHFNNKYWQTYRLDNNSHLYLYNAFYDNREDTKRVRIIGTTDDWLALKATELK